MQVYFYAKSGVNIGLDSVRRCASVASLLQEFNPILCTTDFSAGEYAKEYLGIKEYISINVLSNLPNIIEQGDMLIYDSNEGREFIEKHLKDFCSTLAKIGDVIPYDSVNTSLFKPQNNSGFSKTFFFGDDDYTNILLNLCQNSPQQPLALLLGHYFLENEKELAPYFSSILADEEYIKTIQNTKYLLSGSINACLESLYCGNSPVFYAREDKKDEHLSLLEKYNIPIITGDSLSEIIEKFEKIIPLLTHEQ